MAAIALWIGALLLTPAASADASALRWTDDVTLEVWIERELNPYLAEILSQHPRFKHRPLRLVSMEGEHIREDADELSREILERVTGALLRAEGVNLVLAPQKPESGHCQYTNEPDYHIALEIKDAGHNLNRVSVRVLDIAERRWVSGFGLQWQGELTRGQRNALTKRRGGATRLGLRERPFNEAQADLLAQRLADAMVQSLCGFAGEPPVVFVEEPLDAPAMVTKTVRLVGRYLARSEATSVVRDPTRANLVLTGKAVLLDGDLHQFWVGLNPIEQSEWLPALETEAYVRFRPRAPVITPSVAQTDPIPRVVRRPVRAAHSGELLAPVTILVPPDPRNCRAKNPWRFGADVLAIGQAVPTGGCLALEVRSYRDAEIFLLNIDANANLVRLVPSSCRTFGRVGTHVRRGQPLRFPSAKTGRRHALAGPRESGTELFYVIAATDTAAAEQIEAAIAAVADACNVASSPQPRTDANAWLQAFLESLVGLEGRVQWQSVRVAHGNRPQTVARGDQD